jgi:hypothetical protein
MQERNNELQWQQRAGFIFMVSSCMLIVELQIDELLRQKCMTFHPSSWTQRFGLEAKLRSLLPNEL